VAPEIRTVRGPSSQIEAWQKALLEGASGVFGGNREKRQKADEALVAPLYP